MTPLRDILLVLVGSFVGFGALVLLAAVWFSLPMPWVVQVTLFVVLCFIAFGVSSAVLTRLDAGDQP